MLFESSTNGRHNRQFECDVFLSSAFRDFMEDRAAISALDKTRIWAVEERRPDLDLRQGMPPFSIVDTLVEQIRKSAVFICVLRDRYGSSVFEDAESVSFLETEIYQAALFHNNAHFFLMEPFNPDARLRGLLELVQAVRPGIVPTKAEPREKVLDGIKRVLDDTRNVKRRSWVLSVRRLVNELAFRRGYPRQDIEFLDKVFRPVSRKPNKNHVQAMLDNLSEESGMEKRLTRMWIALRELSAAPYDQPQFVEYLPLWDQALGAWASAAAWYGLHGHLYAGRLAAVNSILRIRMSMHGSVAEYDRDQYIHGTKGGRASEYYSIAKLVRTKRQQDQYLDLALKDIQDSLAITSGDRSGYLAIRGHIYLAQGQLDGARTDFEAMKVLRQSKGDNGGVGEALSDLGLVHMRLGNGREARSLLRQGADLLAAAGRHPFAIRAQKRLAFAYLRSGHPLLALKQLCAAYDKAQEHQIYGQVTPLMETMYGLACRLGLWRRRSFE